MQPYTRAIKGHESSGYEIASKSDRDTITASAYHKKGETWDQHVSTTHLKSQEHTVRVIYYRQLFEPWRGQKSKPENNVCKSIVLPFFSRKGLDTFIGKQSTNEILYEKPSCSS